MLIFIVKEVSVQDIIASLRCTKRCAWIKDTIITIPIEERHKECVFSFEQLADFNSLNKGRAAHRWKCLKAICSMENKFSMRIPYSNLKMAKQRRIWRIYEHWSFYGIS